MKKTLLALLLALPIMISVSSCKKDAAKPLPTAVFTVDYPNGNTLSNGSCWVNFFNESTNAVSCTFDYGDGSAPVTVVGSNNAPHQFTASGTFDVSCRATNETGSITAHRMVTILPAVVPPATSVTITSIELTNYSYVDASGSALDIGTEGSYPDVYVTVSDANNNVLATSSTYFNEASTAPLTFSTNIVVSGNWFNTNIFVDAWDKDSINSDDYIGYALGFTPSSYASSRPAYIDMPTGSNSVSARVYLTWN